MSEPRKANIVAIVGMPGAGKTESVNYLSENDWPKIYFGGIVYAELSNDRIYSNGSLMGALLGGVNDDGEGVALPFRRIFVVAHKRVEVAA